MKTALPKILAFDATPSPATAGKALRLDWTTEHASRIRIQSDPPGLDVTSRSADRGSYSYNPPVAATFTYTLTARGNAGFVSKEIEVEVLP
jgi:hypothetical protein